MMTRVIRHLCRILSACLALGVLSPAHSPAQEPGGDGRAAIAAALAGSLAAGYQEKSVEKFLSVYAAEARVVNYIWGEIDRETLGKKTLEDFSLLSGTTARVDVLEAQIEGAVALVTINLGTAGVLGSGQRVSRQDRYYLRMRRDAARWLIVEQSYRPDFRSSPAPHGGPR
jgi:ketosteroid isomerase-like protein